MNSVCNSPSCYQWPIGRKDRYCGWCGQLLVELALRFEVFQDNQWVPLDPPVLTADRRPKLRLSVRHIGQMGRITIKPKDLKSLTRWLTFENRSEPQNLEPGGELSFPVKSCTPPTSITAEMTAAASLRTDIGEYEAEFEVIPPPRFVVTALQEPRLSDASSTTIDLSLKLETGHTRILQPPAWREEWGRVRAPGLEFPLEVDSKENRELALKLDLEPTLSRQLQGQSGTTLTGTLSIACVGHEHVPLRLPVDLKVHLTPQMSVEPFRDARFHELIRLEGLNEKEPFLLTISNAPGSEELLLQRIEVEAEPPWIAPPLDRTLQRVPAGRSLRLHLPLALETLNSESGEARLRIHSNASIEDYRLQVRRLQPAPFEGSLIVDLGTCNTCATLADELGHLSEVSLLDGPTPEEDYRTLPSILYYDRLEPERDYRPGPEELSGDPGLARASVRAAKRFLGEPGYRFEVYPYRESDRQYRLTPREVVSDLYRWVARRAQAQLLAQHPGQARVLLKKAVITHPSRFSVTQIDALKHAIREALPEGETAEVHVLQEPVGGALAFLNDPEQAAERHELAGTNDLSYGLLVYDCGGGTVDITYLQVASRRRASLGHSTEPAQVNQEALTKALRELIVSKCLLMQGNGTAELACTEDEQENLELLLKKLGTYSESERSYRAARERIIKPGRSPAGRRPPDRRLYLSFKEDAERKRVGFSLEQILPLEEALQHKLSGEYRYSVKARVLGATGHRRFGGEDVTRALEELLQARLRNDVQARYPDSKVELPVDFQTSPPYQVLSARSNATRLRRMAESMKIQLSQGEQPTGYETLDFYFDGLLRAVSGSELMAHVPYPTLAELETAVAPRVQETITLARKLIEAQNLSEPDVLLAIGKGSRLPIIERSLRAAFSQAAFHAPADGKECVVRGAALRAVPIAATGPVSVYLEKNLTTTTSRLGILSLRGARTIFSEIVPAGRCIPEEGLSVPITLRLQGGQNQVQLLENLGLVDEVQLPNGRRNPEIRRIQCFEFELDEESDPFELDDARLIVQIDNDLVIRLKLVMPSGETLTFDPVPNTEFGQVY